MCWSISRIRLLTLFLGVIDKGISTVPAAVAKSISIDRANGLTSGTFPSEGKTELASTISESCPLTAPFNALPLNVLGQHLINSFLDFTGVNGTIGQLLSSAMNSGFYVLMNAALSNSGTIQLSGTGVLEYFANPSTDAPLS